MERITLKYLPGYTIDHPDAGKRRETLPKAVYERERDLDEQADHNRRQKEHLKQESARLDERETQQAADDFNSVLRDRAADERA